MSGIYQLLNHTKLKSKLKHFDEIFLLYTISKLISSNAMQRFCQECMSYFFKLIFDINV